MNEEEKEKPAKRGQPLSFTTGDALPDNNAAADSRQALLDPQYCATLVPLTLATLAHATETRRLRDVMNLLLVEIRRSNKHGR